MGKAIVRAVLRGRGADVYVPGYTGAISIAMSVMPRSLRDAIHQLMRADTVLTDIDQSARRIQHTHNSRGQTRCSWTQFSCAARHSRPRPQILESSTGAVDKFVTTNTDHATPAKRHKHGFGARNLTQTLRSRRIPTM